MALVKLANEKGKNFEFFCMLKLMVIVWSFGIAILSNDNVFV